MDFDRVDCGGVAETEVNARIVSRGEGAAGDDIPALAHSVGGEVDGGSGCVAGTLGAADELEFNPMMVVGGDVAQQGGVAVQRVNDDSRACRR